MYSLSPRQKFYFVSGGVLLFLLLFLFVVVSPRFRALSLGLQEVQAAKQEHAALELQLHSLRMFAKRLGEFESTIQEIQENMFVEAKAPIEFVQFLERMAMESSVNIEIISVNPTTGKAFGSALLFEIRMKGSGPQALRFLATLEQAPYLIEIQSFQLQGLERQDEKTLKTYPSGSVSGRASFLVYTR